MISLKIKAIAFFIEKEDKVVDIGCDHAYLGIYLKRNNLCKMVVCSDVNENALNNAKDNIKKYKLKNKIKCLLSDGLNQISEKDYDTIVIAGMGTKTIKEILDNKEKLKHVKKIILSSNNEQYELRKYMNSINYKLIDDKVVYEKNHYYVVSKYVKGSQKLSKSELLFGINRKDKINYYNNLFDENKKILKKIPFTKFKRRYIIKKNNKLLKNLIKSK